MRMIPAILSMCGLVLAGAALAQQKMEPTPPDAAFVAYMKTEPYKRLMTQAMARVSPTVAPRCPKQTLGEPVVMLLTPIPFGADGLPQSGGWRTSVPVRGCGADVQANFSFFVGQEGRVITLPTLPGTTKTDLQQQRDGFAQSVVALNAPTKGCSQFEVVNTNFEQFGTIKPPVDDPGPKAFFRPWVETWTLLGCGKRWTVPLNFNPNRLGTQIGPSGDIVGK